MSRYHLDLGENERLLMMFALGSVHNIPPVISEQTEPPATPIELARRLVNLVPTPGVPTPPRTEVPPPAAAAPGPQDPDVRELGPIIPLSIVKTGEGKKERLIVEWREMKNAGRSTQIKKASCWFSEKAIWPRVLERVRQSTVFLVKENNGYLNIVGVKQS